MLFIISAILKTKYPAAFLNRWLARVRLSSLLGGVLFDIISDLAYEVCHIFFFIHINTLKYVFNISPRFSPTLCWSLWDNNLYVTTVAGERSSTELFSFVCFVWVLERILMYTAFLVLSWFLGYISSGAYFTAGDYDLRDFEVILFSQELLFLGKSQMSLRNSSLNT